MKSIKIAFYGSGWVDFTNEYPIGGKGELIWYVNTNAFRVINEEVFLEHKQFWYNQIKRLDKGYVGKSVSTATLVPESVIASILFFMEYQKYNTLVKSVLSEYGLDEEHEERIKELDDESKNYLLEDLFDAMNLIAPVGTYFSGHMGDGANIGFWEIEESQAWRDFHLEDVMEDLVKENKDAETLRKESESSFEAICKWVGADIGYLLLEAKNSGDKVRIGNRYYKYSFVEHKFVRTK